MDATLIRKLTQVHIATLATTLVENRSACANPFLQVRPIGLTRERRRRSENRTDPVCEASDDDSKPDYKYCIEHGGAIILGTGRDSDLRDMEALLKTADPISLKRFSLPSPYDQLKDMDKL